MHRRTSFVGAMVVAVTLLAGTSARAAEMHMLLFEHDITDRYGALMLVAPDEPTASVSGLIDSDREVVFNAAENGMHVGAAWDLTSMDDVVGLLSGSWRLFLEDDAANVSELNFNFNGSAVDTASLILPTAPSITSVGRTGSDVHVDWTNNDPQTQAMLAGAIDWDASVLLKLDAVSSGSTNVGNLPIGEYEILLGSMFAGPGDAITDFDHAGWEEPMLWLGTMTSSSLTVVPEPTSAALLAIAAVGLVSRRRRPQGNEHTRPRNEPRP